MGLVREFHIAFDIPVKECPTIPYIHRVMLRQRLIQEEFREVDAEFDRITSKLRHGVPSPYGYSAAQQVYTDIARLAKELSDLRYVCEGAELEFGIPSDAVYAEVHRSNMSKLGADGKPVRRYDRKVLKGPNYEEANVLRAMGITEGDSEDD